MSMNFNNPTLTPKKNNNKLIAEIVIAVVLGTIGAIGIWHYVMDGFSTSSESLTVDQITNRCIEKLRDMLGAEPSKLSVNTCVGTVLGEINK